MRVQKLLHSTGRVTKRQYSSRPFESVLIWRCPPVSEIIETKYSNLPPQYLVKTCTSFENPKVECNEFLIFGNATIKEMLTKIQALCPEGEAQISLSIKNRYLPSLSTQLESIQSVSSIVDLPFYKRVAVTVNGKEFYINGGTGIASGERPPQSENLLMAVLGLWAVLSTSYLAFRQFTAKEEDVGVLSPVFQPDEQLKRTLEATDNQTGVS